MRDAHVCFWGVSGGVRARNGGDGTVERRVWPPESQSSPSPSDHSRINHPTERKRGAQRTRGDVPPSLTQWRRSGGGLWAWPAGSQPRTRPFGRTTGPAAEPSSAGQRRRVGQSIARNTSG
ncbi:unnamed protein product [Macrosiphum euphorbiae]|uniref:Uncharacterized protein n=1 Tax=Macrosiphum euphorbiae TaxID=13131 RepID=A0AAV0VZU7_9HEMI|nr:unnamed protein product [Macrosiphum euphorbiae]